MAVGELLNMSLVVGMSVVDTIDSTEQSAQLLEGDGHYDAHKENGHTEPHASLGMRGDISGDRMHGNCSAWHRLGVLHRREADFVWR